MEKKIVLWALFLSMMFVCIAGAQTKPGKSNIIEPSTTQLLQKPNGFLNSLFDPSRFSMKHSYSVSLFSMGRQTFSQGLYLNTMNFRFSNPLTMQVSVGFMHQPLGKFGNMPAENGKLFLQHARLQYKPSDKMSFTIDYQSYPYSYPSPYYYYR